MDCDVLIAGAGCAGLSLAVHLLDAGAQDLDVLLLDPRPDHAWDRTWCYWPLVRHPFEPAVRHSWRRWRVMTEEGETTAGSRSLAYRCLPSDAFYGLALDRIERAPNIRLLRGTSVESLHPAGGSVRVSTTSGELRARQVFDGRPPVRAPAGEGEIDWLQHFVGVEVETERPVFDPSVATLMDFRIMDGSEIRFMYLLPFGERRALLEDTYFGGEPRDEGHYLASIGRYLEEHMRCGSWRETYRERGAIPMRTDPPARAPHARVTHIGVRAGLARSSTGYAFLAIQRDSARIAEHVTAAGVDAAVPRTRAYSRAATILDRVFLAHLERRPGAAPEMYRSLFAGVEPRRLARFMFDGGTAADRLAVMRALPAGPLTRQALCSLGPSIRDLLRRNG